MPSPEELRARSRELERELGLVDPDITRVRDQTRQWVAAAMGHTNGTEEKQLTPSELRAKSERLAREFAPVRVATFDC